MANLLPIFLNGVSSTVQAGSGAIGSATDTGINIASGDGANFGTIGTNRFIPAVIVDTSTSPETVKEYVWITARSTDALTVVRQAEDSTRFPASTSTIAADYVIAACVTSAAMEAGFPTGAFPARLQNYLSWSFDPMFANASVGRNNSGVAEVSAMPWPVTASVTSVTVYVTTAGATLTSNTCWIGIYNDAGSLVAQTADQSASWTSTGLITMALTGGPISLPGGAGARLFVVQVASGTTCPGFAHASTNYKGALMNAGIAAGGGPRVAAKLGFGTSLPSTTSFSDWTIQGNAPIWAALS